MRICIAGRANYSLLQRRAAVYAEAGHDVHVISLEDGEVPGATVHIPRARFGGGLRYLAALPEVAALLRRLRPDVLDLHGVSTYGLYGLLPTSAAVVATIYGPDLYTAAAESGWVRAGVRRVLRRADLVFGSTPAIADYARDVTGVDVTDKLVVRSWGVDVARIQADGDARRARARADLGVAADAPVVIHARHLIDLWRPEVIVEAAAALHDAHPDAQVWFVHPEPNARGQEILAALTARVHELGLDGVVRILGPRPYDEFLSLLHAADVFVCVGSADLLASTLLEALAVGLVPVLSDLPAYREVVQDGENGILLDPVTPDTLGDALVDVAGRLPELRRQWGGPNQDLVRADYDERVCTLWMVDQYQRAIDAESA